MKHAVFIVRVARLTNKYRMLFETKNYPVVFLSYNEPNYKRNLDILLSIRPDTLHVHGIKGSDAAHKNVAKTVFESYPNSTHVIVVDGDNEIHNDFFEYRTIISDSIDLNKHVISFSARNVINGNQYGNGSIKVWPIQLLFDMETHENSPDVSNIDFDTSKYLELNYSGSDTVVNSTPLQAWRSGYREGIKLTEKINYNDINWRNYDRLWRWMHIGSDVTNGLWAIYGARLGCYRGLQNKNNGNVKDFDYLDDVFYGFYQLYKDNLVEEINRIGHLIKLKTLDSRIVNVIGSEKSKEFRDTVPCILRSPETFLESASEPVYDVVFISYNELNADKNFELLKKKKPDAKRVNGIKGIHNAHIEAAKLCTTDYFWVVDADAILVDSFEFKCRIYFHEPEAVRVWRSQNPVNGLIYGNGGVKLLPRMATLRMRKNMPDMTTSICDLYKPVLELSNITEFNTDSFNSWKSAFRECAKLSSQVIERQYIGETLERLNTWCTVGEDKPYGKYVLEGAVMGRAFGIQNKNNIERLKLVNDFDWLKNQYDKFY
jgi:cellulose synthase/poly-beta-1,6-N-acetylglucosamine synthase-like glycosyltransferase